MNYTDMTDEEYDILDEELTRTAPKVGPSGGGWISQRELRLMGMSNVTINYLFAKATTDNKTPAQIIDELVSEKIAAGVSG